MMNIACGLTLFHEDLLESLNKAKEKYDLKQYSFLTPDIIYNANVFYILKDQDNFMEDMEYLNKQGENYSDDVGLLGMPNLPFRSIWYQLFSHRSDGRMTPVSMSPFSQIPSMSQGDLLPRERELLSKEIFGSLVVDLGDSQILILSTLVDVATAEVDGENRLVYGGTHIEVIDYKKNDLAEDSFAGYSKARMHLILISLFNAPRALHIQKENIRFKVKHGKKKETIKIKKIIYLTGKKYIKKNSVINGKTIEWDHSWQVMGHWRRIKGIGKDREGEYCQVNRTWVLPHERGEGDLIKKIRVKT